MSAAFRDGLRRAIIGLVHLWLFSDRPNKGDASRYVQMLIYPADLGIDRINDSGRPTRIVVTIEIESYTP